MLRFLTPGNLINIHVDSVRLFNLHNQEGRKEGKEKNGGGSWFRKAPGAKYKNDCLKAIYLKAKLESGKYNLQLSRLKMKIDI